MKQESIPFHIFHIDDHIVERNKRYNTGFGEWYEYYYLQWDIEWLRQKFFQKLQNETRLKLPFYHDEVDLCEMKKVQIPIVGVIVIEGVFSSEKNGEIFSLYGVLGLSKRDTGFYGRVRKRRRTFQSLRIGIGKQRIIT